jgi:hypothetical protein
MYEYEPSKHALFPGRPCHAQGDGATAFEDASPSVPACGLARRVPGRNSACPALARG